MKFSTQEEFGLRCLVQIGSVKEGEGLTIPEISEREGMSSYNVAKILRLLRNTGFIKSARGQTGGYTLTRKPKEIVIHDVLEALGGKLFKPGFCKRHRGTEKSCIHASDCAVRPLWSTLQTLMDNLLTRITLDDLLGEGSEINRKLNGHIQSLLKNAAQLNCIEGKQGITTP